MGEHCVNASAPLTSALLVTYMTHQGLNPVCYIILTLTNHCITFLAGAGIAVVSEIIYVCGGYDGSEHLSSVESYNIHTGHWTSLQRMTAPRCYVGACVLKGELLVVAGYVAFISFNPLNDG